MSLTWMKSRDCLPVLEDERRAVVQKPGREDRGNARVGIRESLARPVDVEESQGDRRNPVRRADDVTELLVVAFRDRVHRGRDQRFRLPRRDRRQLGSALRAGALPASFVELLVRPQTRRDRAVCLAEVLALAVDRHRRGDDESGRARRRSHEALQEAGRRGGVHVDVALDLVHRLTDSDRSGEMNDRIDAAKRLLGELGIADVAFDEGDAVGQIRAACPSWTCGSRLSMTTTSAPSLGEARDEV